MRKPRHILPALVLTLIAIMAGAAVARADSTTTLLGYQFDLVDIKDNGNHTSTWTYAVTASGDEANALSHWTLAIGSCYMPVVSPANAATVTTSTSAAFGCGSRYNCQQATCTATLGKDPTTGVSGIKFENCSPQLNNSQPVPRTQIYQFTVSAVPGQPSEVQLGAKAGSSSLTGGILGPACSPTAVSLEHLSAEPASPTPGVGRFLGQLAMTLGAIAMRVFAAITRG